MIVNSINKIHLPDGDYFGFVTGDRVRISFKLDFYDFQISKFAPFKGTRPKHIIIKDSKAVINFENEKR